MPSKDQDIFDMTYLLDSIDTFTESVETHFENVARSLQDAFRQTPWLPDSVKPRPPPPRSPPMVRPPAGYIEATRIWISEHQAVTAAVVAFLGTGAFIVWRRRRAEKTKRKAKRAKTGARTEVVVLAGSPLSLLTRSISLDLERRGFIVYIPVSTLSEEQVIQAFSRSDIRPLSLDITSSSSTDDTIKKLSTFLTTPQQTVPQLPSHTLTLTAFIYLPSSNHQAQRITALTPSHWSDILTTHLLAPFTIISAFLPLLVAQKSTLLFLSPSITSSLAPQDHATESVVAGAMTQYIKTLRHEVSAQGVNIAELRLGHFDLAEKNPKPSEIVPIRFHHPSRAELTKQRLQSTARGTPIKRLHSVVFDVIERRRGIGSTTFVGQGARTYDLIGRWVPDGIIVGWMMGATATGPPHVVEGRDPRVAPLRPSREGSSEGSAEWEKVDESSSSS